jgi:ribonuclease P protein component
LVTKHNSFHKQERLSSLSRIKELFSKGSFFVFHPFKIIHSKGKKPFCRVMIAVPRRNFKQAVERNLIKRRIRESYRTHKQVLPAGTASMGIDLILLYIDKEVKNFAYIDQKLNAALRRLSKEYNIEPHE